MVTLRVTVTKKGRVFKDTKGLLNKHTQAAVQQLVEMGEQRLDKTLRPRPLGVFLSITQARRGQASQGHYRRSVYGSPVKNLSAFIDDSQVTYGPWLEGISPKNVTTRFKGYSSFRRVGQWLNKQAKQVLKSHVVKIVRDLNR